MVWCGMVGEAQAALRPWLSLAWLLFPALVCGGKGCEGLRALPVCGGTFPAGDREGRQVLLGPCALG